MFNIRRKTDRRSGGLLRRFARGREGLAALEFAIVGPLFLSLVFAILEAGLICTRVALMENAATMAAKYVYLGPDSGGEITQEGLTTYICDKLGGFVVDCEDNITLEMTVISDFQSPPEDDVPCRDSDLELNPTVEFDTGNANEIVYLRLCLTTTVVTPGLGLGLALTKTDTNKYEIKTAMAFVNEPY